MIIKMTVHDNDFSGILDTYTRNIYQRLAFTKYDDYRDKFSSEFGFWVYHDKLRDMVNPNYHGDLTDDDKSFIIKAIKDDFKIYIKNEPLSDQRYMLRNLEVDIVDYVRDQDECGENFYWFQRANVTIGL